MFSLVFLSRSATIEEASCKVVDGKVQIVSGTDKTQTAWASWEDSIEEVGWYKFNVETNEAANSEDQYRCAGALDGYLGQHRIYQRLMLYKDQMALPRNETFPAHWEEWMQKNLDWTQKQANDNKGDKYWDSVNLIIQQLNGLHEGYQLKANEAESLRLMDLLFIQAIGDIYDLITFWDKKTNELWHMECSGLVTITKDYKDLFFGHATWSSFQKMHQVLKTYNIKTKEHKNKRVVISTRMGALGSSDDFWLNDAGLMVLETTNNNFNESLYQKITDKSVLNWIRTLHAMWAATGSEEWTKEFIRENSGTYNNQYICVDTKMFIPGKKPENGMFWVIEQLPGMYHSADATEFLVNQRYFPSINTPWFEDIFNAAGYPEKIASAGERGDYYSYYNSSRYLIFKQEAPKVETLEDFKKLMRRNKYETDEYGHHDPAQQILSRYDLRAIRPTIYGNASAFGGLDTKVCSAMSILHNLTFEAIGSPKHDDGIPAWEFGVEPFENVNYDGLPKKWEFDWINYSTSNVYDRCNFTNQDDCTAVERCGWCLYSQKCFVGSKDGPLDETCESGWTYPVKLQSWAVPVVVSVSIIVVVFVAIVYAMAFFCDPSKREMTTYDQIK